MLQDGDILLCKSDGIIPSLIKWGTGSKYSHVAVIASAKLGWKMGLRKLRLLQLFGLKLVGNKKAANELQKDQDYFCSELCYAAFFHGGGLDIVPEIGDAETTSPGDIARSSVVVRIR